MKRIQLLSLYTALIGAISTDSLNHKTFASEKQRPAEEQTLPEQLDRTDYFLHIANELGWVKDNTTDQLCKGYYKEPAIISKHPNPHNPKEETTHITAKGPSALTEDGISILQKEVIVKQRGRQINADKAYIYRNNTTGKITQIKLTGHVKIQEPGNLIVTDQTTLTLQPETVTFTNSAYHFYKKSGMLNTVRPLNIWGTASEAKRDSEKIITLKNATFSTCEPSSPTWEMSGSRITLDKANNTIKARNAILWWRRIPVFYLPYYSTALVQERKTGFLTPQVGYSNTSGSMVALPFYWNIAENLDYKITPVYMTGRKWQINNTFRYLTQNSRGNVSLGILPQDETFNSFRENAESTFSDASLYDQSFYEPYLNKLTQYSDTRAYFSTENHFTINPAWSSNLYLNYVTDPYYFTQLGTGFGSGSSTSSVDQLLNRIDANYTSDHWEFTGLVQDYQTLHQIDKTTEYVYDQYSRLPDLSTTAYYPDALPHTDFLMNGEFVNFGYHSDFDPDEPTGQRLHLRPGLSFPLTYASAYITPQLWVDNVSYHVEHLQPGMTSTDNRTLPIINIDSGLYFDHPFHFGETDYLQTIEPRFFYLYTPYTNQDNLPNFDTTLLPFSYQQLFSLNRFTGDDRLENANEINFGLTSKILKRNNGNTLFTADIGTGYYITEPKVCLDDGTCTTSANEHIEPLVADLSYTPGGHWSTSASWAWDPSIKATDNTSMRVTYARDQQHLVSLGYSFVHQDGVTTVGTENFSNNYSDAVFALSWNLTQQWSFVSYLEYNLSWHRPDNYYTGLQYDTCCWSLQFINKHTYSSTTANDNGSLDNHFDTSYYVQLSLKGLGGLSNGNIDGLLSTMPGYASAQSTF